MTMKNLFSLEGRVAVVTGGSRGIGKMIARGFLEYGAKVYITARKAEACDAAAAELSSLGPNISIRHWSRAATGPSPSARTQVAPRTGSRIPTTRHHGFYISP